MALLAQILGLADLIFDIRGFMPEEYIDAGVWQAGGVLYRITKVVERRLLAASDAFVVLTHRAREILFPGCSMTDSRGRPLEVIPCCVDMQRFGEATPSFRDSMRMKLNVTGRRVLAYAGALGGWYLSSEMADFIALAHEQDPTIFALVLTQSCIQAEAFRRRLGQLGLSPGDSQVGTVSPDEMPDYLVAADFGFCFIKPGFSKLSSSPTKIGEYLASGLPVLCNVGIGDIDELLVTNRVGVLLETFGRQSYARALHDLEALTADINLRQRCRAVARRYFDLKTIGSTRYHSLYIRVHKRRGQSEVTNS
jgi:hypothetical protein